MRDPPPETPLGVFGGAGTEVETDMTITAGDPEHAAAAAKHIWRAESRR